MTSLAFVYISFSLGTRGTQNVCLNHQKTYLMWKTCVGKLISFAFQGTPNRRIEQCTEITAREGVNVCD